MNTIKIGDVITVRLPDGTTVECRVIGVRPNTPDPQPPATPLVCPECNEVHTGDVCPLRH